MTAKKKEQEEIKRGADELTQFLKKRAEKQREEFLKDQKRLGDKSLLMMIFGSNRDALVLKFVKKLKDAVQERKDVGAQKSSEQIIREIMKKQ